MNILLVNPEMILESYLPISITSIAGYIQQFGYDPVVYSCQGKSIEDFEAIIESQKWDIIGFTSIISHYKNLKLFTKIARHNCHSAKIVIGGPLANVLPDYLLKNLDADLVICGEGEFSFLRLYAFFSSH